MSQLIERAVVSLGLDRPLHPWWLGEAKPPRPVQRAAVLASSCPLPNDLDPDLVLESFPSEDRAAVAEQLDDAYRYLVALDDEAPEVEGTVRVQLGVPLIAHDRALLRVCTRNLYGKNAALVTGDFHAWLDPAGNVLREAGAAQVALASLWTPWVVGRSPGLRAAVDLNLATESELMMLPHVNQKSVRAILAARPFRDVEQLGSVKGIGRDGLEVLRALVTV